MNNEIKEILDRLKKCDYDDFNKVLDYITNLQEDLEKVSGSHFQLFQENKRLKENAEHNDKVVDKAKWNEMIYKSRNEKIIRKISLYRMDDITMESNRILNDLLNVALGEDKDG